MLTREAIKAALRRLSPAERDRLEVMLAGRSVRSGLGERPQPEPVKPRVVAWDDGSGKNVEWGAMPVRYPEPARRDWVL